VPEYGSPPDGGSRRLGDSAQKSACHQDEQEKKTHCHRKNDLVIGCSLGSGVGLLHVNAPSAAFVIAGSRIESPTRMVDRNPCCAKWIQ